MNTIATDISTTYARDGFCAGPQILNENRIEELLDELERVIRDNGRSDVPQPVRITNIGDESRPIWQVVDIWQASEPFRRVATDPTLVALAARLAGARELRLWHDQIQFKPVGRGGVNMWHQDSPLWGILQPKEAQITAWIALDDAGVDNGCMSMVPGSHEWGVQMDLLRTLQDYESLPAEDSHGHKVAREFRKVKKGHVHFHHPLTWHGSHGNRSDRPRRAFAIHYMSEKCRYDASGEHTMKAHVQVQNGEVLSGSAFPLLWKDGAVV